MSRAKLSVLVVGLIAAAAIVFVGANHLSASSSKASACENSSQAKSASACPASSCAKSAKTAGAAGSCTYSAKVAGSGKSCSMSSAECAKACGEKNVKTASVETVNAREGKRIVLTGHYVCGHCELGLGAGCQPAFQTKDGKNYLLVKNNLSSELRHKSRDASVEIVTRVKKLDGAKYLEVEAIRNAS